MIRKIVLDTETTGFSRDNPLGVAYGHKIIEIGCIEMIGRQVTGKQFHVYLNPEMEITPEASKINGYTWEMLKDMPKFSDISDSFLSFISGATLIAHNAKFDMAFIKRELDLLRRVQQLRCLHSVVCTQEIAKRIRPYPLKNNLDTLCQVYGVDNSNRAIHGALLDAKLLSKVYLAMTAGDKAEYEIQDTSRRGMILSHLTDLIHKYAEKPEVVLIQEIKDFVEGV